MYEKANEFNEWMDEYEAAVEAGQSSISRAEAIRRFQKYQDIKEANLTCHKIANENMERQG